MPFNTRHELVHALGATWAPRTRLKADYVIEGLATWAQYGYAEALLRTMRLPDAVDRSRIDVAVDHRFTFPASAGADPASSITEYFLWGSFFAWLESRLGRPETWQLARECYVGGKPDEVFPAALGLPDMDATLRSWGEWIKSQLG